MKWTRLFIVALLLCLFATWRAANVLDTAFLVSLPVVVVLISYLTPANNWVKALTGTSMLLAYLACSQIGVSSYHDAYNECIQKGEVVRKQLSEFYQINQQYPEQLSQTQSPQLCKPIFHGSILNYHKTANGYWLSFDDGFVEHLASESTEFIAHK